MTKIIAKTRKAISGKEKRTKGPSTTLTNIRAHRVACPKVHSGLEEPLRDAFSYPCELCVNEVPYYYCTACMAEYDKRKREERERDNAKQRKAYARRQHFRRMSRPATACKACGEKVEAKRKDALYCSAACRQRTHRQRAGAAATAGMGTVRQ